MIGYYKKKMFKTIFIKHDFTKDHPFSKNIYLGFKPSIVKVKSIIIADYSDPIAIEDNAPIILKSNIVENNELAITTTASSLGSYEAKHRIFNWSDGSDYSFGFYRLDEEGKEILIPFTQGIAFIQLEFSAPI